MNNLKEEQVFMRDVAVGDYVIHDGDSYYCIDRCMLTNKDWNVVLEPDVLVTRLVDHEGQ